MPRFNLTALVLKKRAWVKMGLLMGVVLLNAVPVFPQDYPPGILWVTFHSGAIDSLYHDSTGFILCGIPYIDSVNRANNCQDFRFIGHPALPLSTNDYHVIFPDSANIPALAAAYETAAEVRWARPDYYVEFQFTPNDSFFSDFSPCPGGCQEAIECEQWNLKRCSFEGAWDITQGDTGVVIAVIDLGCFYNHPDIQGNLWVNVPEDFNGNRTFEPWCSDSTVPGDLDSVDNDGNGFIDDVIGYNFPFSGAPNPYIPIDETHGTFTSSIAAAVTNNSIGVSGAGFKSRLMVISIEFENFSDSTLKVAVASGAAKGIQYAAKMGAEVVSMSFTTEVDSALILAVDTAFAKNCVMVAAAGNNGTQTSRYPASFPKVLSVTGVDFFDAKHPIASYSDSVDLSAPIKAWSTALKLTAGPPQPIYNYGWDYKDFPCPPNCPPIGCWENLGFDDTLPRENLGTSWSAPLVAGAAALVKSAYPNMTNAQIIAKLKSSTDSVHHKGGNKDSAWENKMGTGRLNSFKAVTFFGNIPNLASDTTLDGVVYVSGDITVPAGKTLTLDAGTILKFVSGDVMGSTGNPSPGKGQLIVKGTLTCLGNESDSIILTSFQSSPQAGDWAGVLIDTNGRANIEFTRFSYADTALAVRGDTATVVVYNSTFNYFNGAAVSSRSAKTKLGGIFPIPNPPDCGRNNFLMKTATSGAKAVIKSSSPGGTLKAEGNYWDSVPPPSSYFSGNVDRTPYLTGVATPDSCNAGGQFAQPPPEEKVAVRPTVPTHFELDQNYPNPFNPTSTIRYALPKAAKVELKIYNILGQAVRTLVNEHKEAGYYQADWDGKDQIGRPLSSGVYIYKIQAGDFVETKKMQLIK